MCLLREDESIFRFYTCKCSRRPPTDSKLASHLSQRQSSILPCGLSFSGACAGNRIVVGAERMGDNDGFDSLLRESSSSTSSSSIGVGCASLSLLSFFDGEDSLEMGESRPPCDLNAPKIPLQLFVKLLFSFTCGFDRMHPLKSSGIGSPSSDEAVVVGELHLAVLIFASEVTLFKIENCH